MAFPDKKSVSILTIVTIVGIAGVLIFIVLKRSTLYRGDIASDQPDEKAPPYSIGVDVSSNQLLPPTPETPQPEAPKVEKEVPSSPVDTSFIPRTLVIPDTPPDGFEYFPMPEKVVEIQNDPEPEVPTVGGETEQPKDPGPFLGDPPRLPEEVVEIPKDPEPFLGDPPRAPNPDLEVPNPEVPNPEPDVPSTGGSNLQPSGSSDSPQNPGIPNTPQVTGGSSDTIPKPTTATVTPSTGSTPNNSTAGKNPFIVLTSGDAKETHDLVPDEPKDPARKLHGAYIKGNSGPEMMMYPALVALVNFGFYAARRKRRNRE